MKIEDDAYLRNTFIGCIPNNVAIESIIHAGLYYFQNIFKIQYKYLQKNISLRYINIL